MRCKAQRPVTGPLLAWRSAVTALHQRGREAHVLHCGIKAWVRARLSLQAGAAHAVGRKSWGGGFVIA